MSPIAVADKPIKVESPPGTRRGVEPMEPSLIPARLALRRSTRAAKAGDSPWSIVVGYAPENANSGRYIEGPTQARIEGIATVIALHTFIQDKEQYPSFMHTISETKCPIARNEPRRVVPMAPVANKPTGIEIAGPIDSRY